MEYLKIITYNLCWEGLEAEKKKPFGKGKIDMSHCNVNNKNICISNIANILTNSSNYDFILLQEIVENQWSKLLIAIKDFMPNFEEHYKWILTNQNGDKKAGIMVIYNKKYSIKYQMEGELETSEISISNKIGGRPYQIIIFNENLVVLNVHFPHKEDIKPYINFEKTLSTKLNTELRNIIELKNPKYQIIMGGDFNMDPRHFIQRVLKGLNRKFYLPNIKINSCCDPLDIGKTGGYRMGIDYIFNTISRPIVYKTLDKEYLKKDKHGNKMTSDHLPIIAEIPINSILKIDKKLEREINELYSNYSLLKLAEHIKENRDFVKIFKMEFNTQDEKWNSLPAYLKDYINQLQYDLTKYYSSSDKKMVDYILQDIVIRLQNKKTGFHTFKELLIHLEPYNLNTIYEDILGIKKNRNDLLDELVLFLFKSRNMLVY